MQGQGGITTATCGVCNETFIKSICSTKRTCQKCDDRFAPKTSQNVAATQPYSPAPTTTEWNSAFTPKDHDPVNHPQHYNSHSSGVECITITEHFNFCIGNAIKYLWRADHKNGLEDLKKAEWYIKREIKRRGSDT